MRRFVGDEAFEAVAPRIVRVPHDGAAQDEPPTSQGAVMSLPLGLTLVSLSGVGLGVMAWFYWVNGHIVSAVVVGLFDVMLVLVGFGGYWQQYQGNRVAAIMHESASPIAQEAVPPDSGRPGVAPPLRLDIYNEGELQPLAFPYRAPVTDAANIIGLAPKRILYLYNFFSPESMKRKLEGNWRRFGPVFFLGSPADVSVAHTFALDLSQTVGSELLTSPEAFDARLAAASEKALSLGDKKLKGISSMSGGYPQHLFLCTDGSWRHGVETLFDRADLVILDASLYDPQRAGLGWEIGQLINRVATDRFVVLADAGTDQASLCASFRGAWASMRHDSPSNRTDAGPVRWVVLDRMADEVLVPVLRPPAEVDPSGLYGELNFVMRHLVDASYARAIVDDRIYGLLAGDEPPPATR